MKEVLHRWLVDVAGDTVTLAPTMPLTEARDNCWSFSLPDEEGPQVSTEDLSCFLSEVLKARTLFLSDRKCAKGGMIFYCWFDEQATQLRFSLISSAPGRLPFDCLVRRVTNLSDVLERFVASHHHKGIPWTELEPVLFEKPEPELKDFVLDVWVTEIP